MMPFGFCHKNPIMQQVRTFFCRLVPRYTGTSFRRAFIIVLAVCMVLNLVILSLIPHHLEKTIRKYLRDSTSDVLKGSETETLERNFLRFLDQTEMIKTRQSACPEMTIRRPDDIPHFSKDTVCRPHLPSQEACKYTAELFAADPSIATCHDQEDPPYELCSISEDLTNRKTSTFEAKCDLTVCDSAKQMHLEIVGPSDGEMWQFDIPRRTSGKKVEWYIERAAEKTRKNGFNFLFLSCVGLKKGQKISQMLTLLPPENILKHERKVSSEKINVNVILLDSVSRPHFYRSLPKTAKYLREKQEDPNYGAHIFDFELFQSVHGHTHENEHALFSGTLFPRNYTREDKERAPTNMEVLFGTFKSAGYQTMFLDDLCWKSSYGLTESLNAFNWTSLQEKIKTANIDSTGITDASCKILSRYDKVSPFHDNDDHQICFNGKHHHRHLFDYVTKYLQAIGRTSQIKPLFSYTETNVAHDDIGVRVQTLDQDLTDFIGIMSTERNTFTIIFADHGNTYTEYQVDMLEGRLEMYHPVLLVVLPKQLGEKFGDQIVTNLKTNQYRLLNLFDIRAGLVELAKYDSRSKLNQVGIFGKISEERTCDDLQLSMPNFCICQGWDIPVETSTAHWALAEFAIGQLNNKIQESLLASRRDRNLSRERHILFGACQRLRLQTIGNVRQRHTAEGTLVTTMDAKVQSGNIVEQEELIMLQVESSQRAEKKSYEMKLAAFNRISHYGIYEQCADPDVELKLCVCNKSESSFSTGTSLPHSVRDIVGANSNVRKLKPCLLLIRRTFRENEDQEDFVGLEVYEMANVCNDLQFTVTFNAVTDNLRSSTNLPIILILKARSVYFVTALMTEVGYNKSRLNLSFHIVTEKEEKVKEN